MDKIIRAHHRGLGDSLQLSVLASAFHSQGHDVYLSSETPCNDQVYDLVWGFNPFVIGKINKPGNCGEIPGLEYRNICDSFIGNWELINGLDYNNDYPIIYYIPNSYSGELDDVTIFDMSCNSRKDDYTTEDLQNYVNANKDKNSRLLTGDGVYSLGEYDIEPLEVRNIYQLCDYIASCKKYVCLNSGGHSLASALKRNKNIDVDCLVTHTATFHSMYERRNFFYPNINYIWL